MYALYRLQDLSYQSYFLQEESTFLGTMVKLLYRHIWP